MYPISNALKAKFASNAKQYARITVGSTVIDNSRIRLGSFSVNRYALAEDTVVFGSCVAAEFNVTLENGDGAFSTGTFLGQEAFVEVGCDISGTVTYVPLGYFKFDMVTAQASALKLSALDRMMKFETNVNPTPYSVSGTVSSLIDTVCTACGVTRGTFTLPVNGTLALSGELTDVKTYRDILRWIGEVTGTIAYIGYDGNLYFGWYSGTEDFSVAPTNRAQGSISDDSTTITSVSIVQGENMVTAGTGAKIVIRDNALIHLASATAQTIADNLYNHVNGFTYRTFEAGVFPMPHIAPLDCGVYSDLDGNDFDVCCTDWTFTLNANTKIAGKGGKQAYGRGYTLDESVFTARNIAAGAVTAEKIDVEDLAALRATIAGWNIGTEALYKEVTSGGYTYRVELCAPASITPNTQCITVKRKATGSSTWEIIDTTTYGGQHTAKDFIANGRVRIAPDYDLQEAGVYAIDLEQNGSELYANPNFLNIEEGGSQTHLDATVISSTAADDTMLRMENYGADYAEFRATQGDYGTRNYKEAALSPKEVRVKSNSYSGNPAWEAKMTAEKVSVSSADGTLHTDMEYNGVTADSDDYRASVRASSAGGFLEVVDQNTGKSSVLSLSELTVNDRDILRTHQSLVGGYGTEITQGKNLNTTEFLSVRRFFCPQDVTVATLTNCPTGNAFMMDVFAPISANIDDESASSGSRYRVRKIITWTGNEYIQNCYWGSSGWAYGTWDKIVTNGSNISNAVTWLKTNSSRVSSLDIPHSYADDQRAKIRFDLSTSSQTGGSNAVFGEGYVLTFMWDTTARWDTQFYLPDADGKAPAFRTYRPNSGWSAVRRFVLDSDYTNGTLTANTGSFSESHCRQAGRVVDIHAWLASLPTTTTYHANAIKVSNVSLPSSPVRFVCTCWSGNSIAAYAGYGVLDTYGNITFTKAVANSDKVSFAISYVV